ncbi:MAG TPA: amidase family protein, partial [bacterium]|nr:amidase family protein [bacterium]
LRPTLGRVSRRGCMALSWTLDKLGPLAHGADDCGLVLEALAGPDAQDPACLPEPWFYRRQGLPARRLRLARLEGAEVSGQPEVPANFERALRVLEQWAQLDVARLPPLPYTEVASLILFSEASAAFDSLLMDGAARELAAEETHPVPLALRNIPAKDYINALRLRQRMQREVLAWLSAYDALVTPTIKRVAPPLDARFSQYFGDDRRQEVTTVGNLLGLPAITVPTGFGQRGLPTALQFVGAPGSENLLLALAEAYQQRTDWHRHLPPG